MKANEVKLNYKGYTISQASNNHIMITKDDDMVFHANATKKLTEDELKEKIDNFLKLLEVLD